MQSLGLKIIEEVKKVKMQKLESSMKDFLISNFGGALFICPYCNYESKKNFKGSAKIFQDKFFKCFACGIWRRI